MPFDANKLYATEILAILLQNSDGNYKLCTFNVLCQIFSRFPVLLSSIKIISSKCLLCKRPIVSHYQIPNVYGNF